MSSNEARLRAELRMREEDSRIARKHAEEAAARIWTVDNHAAYVRCAAWADLCAEREAAARGRLIRFNLAQGGRLAFPA